MGKRLHDTEIWEEDWFQDLPNKYKLFFSYIKDKCDNVGIWRPNKNNFQKTVGEPIILDEFLMLINQGKERLLILPSGKWFLKDFFVFQYGNKFTPTSPVHRGALKQMLANGVVITNIIGIEVDEKIQNIGEEGFRKIAYAKDINTVLEGFGYPIQRTINKNKDKNNIIIDINSLNREEKNQKNENKFSGNFKAQGEELFANRINRNGEAERNGENGSGV